MAMGATAYSSPVTLSFSLFHDDPAPSMISAGVDINSVRVVRTVRHEALSLVSRWELAMASGYRHGSASPLPPFFDRLQAILYDSQSHFPDNFQLDAFDTFCVSIAALHSYVPKNAAARVIDVTVFPRI